MTRAIPSPVISRSVILTILAFSVLACRPALARYQTVERVAIGKGIEQDGTRLQDQVTRPATRPQRGTPDPVRTRAEATKPSSAEPSRTRLIRVFRDSCIECHDGDGRGESGRDI